MHVADIVTALEVIAPLEYAADWDNVGLLAGSPEDEVSRVLLTIDLTPAVLEEAIAAGAGLIVAYHPPIFRPFATLTDADPKQRIVLRAMRSGCSIYSPHTALDAIPGGVNDWLAAGLGDGDVRALDYHAHLPTTEQCKLVTFCPAGAVDQLRRSLAAAGAGRIGDYQLCSFEMRGHGTFLGGEGTSPTVGQAGHLERVDEVRLEMVCPEDALALLVATMREFHPYEEPPIEIHPLRARPQRSTGHGRRVTLDRRVTLPALVERIKTHLGIAQIRVAIAPDAPEEFGTIGLCAGAGGSLLDTALAHGCELFLTGEMAHHDVLAAQMRGCTVALAGHTNTERGYLPVLRRELLERLPDGPEMIVSTTDASPLLAM
jgi:dinuclear metal center YbgI/SA1388 family protein